MGMENNFSQNYKPAHKPKGIFGGFFAVAKQNPVAVSVLWSGFFIFFLMISLAVGIFPKLDLEDADPEVVVASSINAIAQTETVAEAPVRIVAETLGIDTQIINPGSRDIEVLDQALLSGAVHYPGSGNLNENSNVFLFGHSTGFRVVQNEAYKAFNGLKDAKEGDLIRVQSEKNEYVYRVSKVSLVHADQALVELETGVKKLTLSTCNSFGAKQERYVVEADFVGNYAL